MAETIFGLFITTAWLLTATIVIKMLAMPAVERISAVKERFTMEELDLVKKYAAMFGLDNDMDIDMQSILEMGRKYEEYLGSEKMEEIHAAINQEKITRYFFLSPKSNGKYRRLTIMMNALDLIATCVHNSFIATITKALGGDKNDEPASI